MKTDIKADIVPLFKHFIKGLAPVLESYHITVSFSTPLNEWRTNHRPFKLIESLSRLFEIFTTFEGPIDIHLELDQTLNSDFELVLRCSLLSNLEINPKNKMSHIQQSFGRKRVQIREKEIEIYFNERIRNTYHTETVIPINHHGFPPYYAEIRKRLKSHFSSISSIEEMATKKNLEDGMFLKSVNQAIAENIENEFFRMSDLSTNLGLSRTQLYRKLKPLIKMTPAKYLIYFRLQKARTLLQETTYNVGQVVGMVGFSSHSHFTRTFHEQFGINPSSIQRNSPELH